MFGDFLKRNITSQANFVEYGYGQVEPNHLSGQRGGQVYAQLPAAASINVLEQGQFAKYDYASGVVNFTGRGEWLLVFNEIKLYREPQQMDCEFAMIKDNYQARVYSPFGFAKDGNVDTVNFDGQGSKRARYLNGKDSDGNTSITLGRKTHYEYALTSDVALDSSKVYYTLSNDTYSAVASPDVANIASYYERTEVVDNPGNTYNYDSVIAKADYWEPYYNEEPFSIEVGYKEAMMPTGTVMVPRLLKTNLGDIMTTNTVKITGTGAGGVVTAADRAGVAAGTLFVPGSTGILEVKANPSATDMVWEVAKNYTMPDHQRGLKVRRVQ